MLRQKWTGDQSALTSVVHYMTSTQDRLSQIKELANEKEQKNKVKYKTCFDRRAKERSFRPGELVLMRTPSLTSKMENEWKGPSSVIEKCDETTYKLNMPDHPRRRVKRHVNLLRKFVSTTAGCMFVYTESELDFGPSIEEKGSRPIVSDRLTNEEKKQIDQLMIEFGGLMQGQPRLTRAAEISIETGSAYPISWPPYRLDSVKLKAMDDAVRELLEMGIVRHLEIPGHHQHCRLQNVMELTDFVWITAN